MANLINGDFLLLEDNVSRLLQETGDGIYLESYTPLTFNNYEGVTADDGMSVGEKIR